MKVYAVITTAPGTQYKPTKGWFATLKDAKFWAKQSFPRNTPIAIVQYTMPSKIVAADWCALLNCDTISAAEDLEMCTPFEYGTFSGIAFENAAMKRHNKKA